MCVRRMKCGTRLWPWLLPAVLACHTVSTTAEGVPPAVSNAGFEAGLTAPWGKGVYDDGRAVWWNSGQCTSTADVDSTDQRSGRLSLHIVNPSPRAPHQFGTTEQVVAISAGQSYRISVWARAQHLASNGAVSIIVDREWKVRPIQLPKGTYDWTRFTGVFSLPVAAAELRILSEDVSDVWIDDLEITPVDMLKETAIAAARFRQTVAGDYQKALADCGTEGVRRKFEALDKRLWPDTPPKAGWSYLISLSAVALGGAERPRPLVAFYNPWCDVFLVTAWEFQQDRARIVDAEVLMADWVRTRGQFPKEPVPAWLRSDVFKPAAVGLAVAESVRQFETLFAQADGSDWRSKLPGLSDPHVVAEFNDTGAALLLMDAIAHFDDLRFPSGDSHPQLPALRAGTLRTWQLALDGDIRTVMEEADETLPATKELLLQTPAERWKSLIPVSAVPEADGGFVFLVPAEQPDRCVSFQFKTESGRQRLKRIDIIHYEGVYKLVQQAAP